MSCLVIIVNYRTADLVIDCLRSLATEVAAPRAIVVDNASEDRSAERIAEAVKSNGWAPWACVLPLEHNGGFAFGNNAAIRPALRSAISPDRFLLLNPDTIARPGAIKELLDFMDAHPEVGIAGSRLEDTRGRIQCSAHRIPTPLSELDAGARLGPLSRLLRTRVVSPPVRDEPHACDWVSGASMMVRRQVFESIGLLDESYFLYFEDPDFCRRAARHGWEVWYVPASRVVHLEGASTGAGAGRPRPPCWFASRRRFFVKHYGLSGLLAADLLWSLGRTSLLRRRLLRLGGTLQGEPVRLILDLLWSDSKAILSGEVRGLRPTR